MVTNMLKYFVLLNLELAVITLRSIAYLFRAPQYAGRIRSRVVCHNR